MAQTEVSILVKLKDEATKALQNIGAEFEQLGGKIQKSSDYSALAKGFVAVGAAASGALALAGKAAMTFEDAMADVRKTTGMSGDEIKVLGGELVKLSGSTRTSAAELAKIALIGGQLGIAKGDIMGFTQAIDRANVALSDEFAGGAEEIATVLGKLDTQFKLSADGSMSVADAMTKIGSTMNSLGATGAATSGYIADFTSRVSGMATTLGMSITDVMGIGAAMDEMGITAEVSGTAMTNMLGTMGANLDSFASAAGLSADTFRQAFEEDANNALLMFAQGLVSTSTSSEDLMTKVDNLGLGGARVAQTLLKLGQNTDLVKERQALAAQEFEKGTSLLSEFDIKNQTTAAEMEKLKNKVNALAITLGNELLPKINNLLDRLQPLIDKFIEFSEKHPGLITSLLGVAAALGAVGSAMLILKAALSPLGASLKALELAFIAMGNAASLSLGLGTVKTMADSWAALSLAARALGVSLGIASKAFLGFAAALLANPITWIVLAIVAAIVLLALAWKNNWGDIQGKTQVVLDFIGQKFEWLKGKVGELGKWFEDMKTKIGGAWDGLKGVFTGEVKMPSMQMPQMEAPSMSGVGQAFQGVKDQLVAAWGEIQTAFENGKTKLGEVFTSIGTTITNLPNVFMTFVSSVTASLGTFFTTTLPYWVGFALGFLIEAVPRMLGQAAGAFITWVTNVGTTIGTFFTTTLPGILTAGWTAFTTWIVQITTTVTTFFAITLPALLLQGFLAFVQWVTDVGTAMLNFFTVTLPAAWQALTTWVTVTLPALLVQAFTSFVNWITTTAANMKNFFLVTFPKMVQDWANQTLKDIIAWIVNTKARIEQWVADGIAFLTDLKNNFISLIINTGSNIMKEVSSWPSRFMNWLNSLPGQVATLMSNLWNSFNSGLNHIKSTIDGWKNSIVGFFNSVADAVGNVINKIKEAFSLGYKAGGNFGKQTGGIVPGPIGQAVPIMAHGGEVVVPHGGMPTGAGFGSVTIQLNVGMYMGTETEKRNIARELYAALLQVAQAQNKSVQEYMGG